TPHKVPPDGEARLLHRSQEQGGVQPGSGVYGQLGVLIDAVAREDLPQLGATQDLAFLSQQGGHGDVHRARNVACLVVEGLANAAEALRVPAVDQHSVAAPDVNLVDIQLRHGAWSDLEVPAPPEGADATGDVAARLLPLGGSAVQDLHTLDASPTQDPPGASSVNIAPGVIDDDGAAIRDAPVIETALQGGQARHGVATPCAGGGAGQVLERVAEHRPRQVLAHVGFPRAVLNLSPVGIDDGHALAEAVGLIKLLTVDEWARDFAEGIVHAPGSCCAHGHHPRDCARLRFPLLSLSHSGPRGSILYRGLVPAQAGFLICFLG